ncbi:Tol-Pal system protein TolR [Vibrio stylophorae]|uniref:Tol-Pal system protein TolR n=2 Tax=Vibrio stylophorae TaxID=659351 RepID=A0ABM8ZST6_9VIBR|nr:biopolymer transporter ExbD [Vibrio stylophorae]CAH0533334.1 Tol-Pal system protein TolR [Vibrio stylophorae]
MRVKLRKQAEEPQIDMTPMLDVVFIMLIFFIVSTTFVRESGLDVERPDATQASEQPSQSIQIALAANGDIYVDRQHVDIRELRGILTRLLSQQPNASVLVQGDEAVAHGRVVAVMDEAKAAGAAHIAVAVDAN